MQNTLVKAISKPKNNPPIALNPSPRRLPLVKKLAKLNPLPTSIKEPTTQIRPDTIQYQVGFSLIKRNINKGMVIQEMFSKKVFFDGTVYFNPTNWKIYASAKKIPAGMHIKYDLLIFLKFLLIIIAKVTIDNAPRKAMSIPGENESKAVFERTGATPHSATTVTRTKNEIILISFFITRTIIVSF